MDWYKNRKRLRADLELVRGWLRYAEQDRAYLMGQLVKAEATMSKLRQERDDAKLLLSNGVSHQAVLPKIEWTRWETPAQEVNKLAERCQQKEEENRQLQANNLQVPAVEVERDHERHQ